MKPSTVLTLIVGFAALITLAAANDFGRILAITASAGWGIVLVVALHLPQILFSGLAWQALLKNAARVRWFVFTRLRWMREAINALLPVAQIGGDFMRARQLAACGIPASASIASVTIDLALELSAQIVFAAIGITLLFLSPHNGKSAIFLLALVGGTTCICVLFLIAQRFGGLRLIELALPALAKRMGWIVFDIDGLHDCAVDLLHDRRRVLLCGSGHLISYFAGALELWASMWALDIHAGWREAIVIESLGQIIRTIGFAIPAALGVQEGGFVLLGALFGIGAQDAIPVALIRRIREIALGVPGLILWRMSHRVPPATAGLATGAAP